MRTRQAITKAELDVLKVLWELGPTTVRPISDGLARQGRVWAYTTVQTLLNRLEAKGYVKRDTRGTAHVYRPGCSRNVLLSQRLRELANDLCEGAAAPLMTALVDSHRFTPEEIAGFRRLLDEVGPRRRETKPKPTK